VRQTLVITRASENNVSTMYRTDYHMGGLCGGTPYATVTPAVAATLTNTSTETLNVILTPDSAATAVTVDRITVDAPRPS